MKFSFVNKKDAKSEEIKEKLINKVKCSIDEQNPDVVVTIGGDGTVLDAVSKYVDQLETILFVTIHTGNLGFYTEFLPKDIDLIGDLLKNGNTVYHTYPLLELKINHNKYYGLNEVTLFHNRHLLETDVYINDEFLMQTRSNGVCISTPTGSTAYNKSLGGAVMDHEVEAFQLTLIAPFETINTRMISPIVLSKGNKITIKPLTENVEVSYDRNYLQKIDLKEIEITLSNKKVKFVKNRGHSLTSKLKDKFIG